LRVVTIRAGRAGPSPGPAPAPAPRSRCRPGNRLPAVDEVAGVLDRIVRFVVESRNSISTFCPAIRLGVDLLTPSGRPACGTPRTGERTGEDRWYPILTALHRGVAPHQSETRARPEPPAATASEPPRRVSELSTVNVLSMTLLYVSVVPRKRNHSTKKQNGVIGAVPGRPASRTSRKSPVIS